MHIIVAGAGQVGRSVANNLSKYHSVTIIDERSDPLDRIPSRLNVVQGNAMERDVLTEANVGSANTVITCTSEDQTNILICSTAQTLSDAFMIARVSDPSYMETWEHARKAFGVDWMVGRSQLTAERLVQNIGFQTRQDAIRDVEYFAGGRIQMAEFEVSKESEITGQTVRQADRYDGLTFGTLLRNGSMIFPDGDTRIFAGDRLVVIGDPNSVKSFGTNLNPIRKRHDMDNIVIAGGGNIGYQTALLLEESDVQPRIIERDPGRATFLSEHLPRTVVLQGDVTSKYLWSDERLHKADALIVGLRPDEQNLLVGLMGKEAGIDLVATPVVEADNIDVFEYTDIDVAVHPGDVVSNEITQFVRESKSQKITSIEDHRGEILELEVDNACKFRGQSIQSWRSILPDEMVIGAIQRGNDVLVPRGHTILKKGDHPVILSDSTVTDDIVETF